MYSPRLLFAGVVQVMSLKCSLFENRTPRPVHFLCLSSGNNEITVFPCCAQRAGEQQGLFLLDTNIPIKIV